MISSKIIWDLFEKHSNELFFIDSSDSYSYKQFYHLIKKTSIEIAPDYKQNEKEALVIDNSLESLLQLFALIYNGATPILLSDKTPKNKIDTLLQSIRSNTKIENGTIIFTSGSTSIPKAILHTYSNHYYSALGSNENLHFQKEDRWLLSLPLHHIGGLSIIFRALLSGGTLVGNDRTLLMEDTIADFKVTHVSVVPTQLRRMMLFPEKLKSLKAILVGGGMIPDDLIAQTIELKLPIYKSYGMSEMASQVTTTKQGASQEELLTSGKVLKYRELKISDDNEILVRGEVLCKKYLNADLPIDAKGWLHTGDLGSLDSDNNLIVLGRKDNMFISGGENIYPEPIEKIILQMEIFTQICITPKDDTKFGQVPILFYKVKNDSELTLEKLKEYLKDKVLPFEVPKEIYFFPKEYKPLGIKPNYLFLKHWINNQ